MNMFAHLTTIAGLVLSLLGAAPHAQAEDLFLPDLTMTTEQKLSSNGREYLEITIKNSGPGYAGPFTAVAEGEGGTNKYNMKNFVNGLAAGEEEVFVHLVGLTTNCNWWRTVTLDREGQVAEKFEDNNKVYVDDDYCPRPDMQVAMTTMNPSGGLNEYQRITITNKGTRDAFNYYLNVTSSGGANTGIQQTIASLAPGASVTYNFYPKSNCNYVVNASVTTRGMYDDYNTTNNTAKADDSCVS
jgi:hypothetical protein